MAKGAYRSVRDRRAVRGVGVMPFKPIMYTVKLFPETYAIFRGFRGLPLQRTPTNPNSVVLGAWLPQLHNIQADSDIAALWTNGIRISFTIEILSDIEFLITGAIDAGPFEFMADDSWDILTTTQGWRNNAIYIDGVFT